MALIRLVFLVIIFLASPCLAFAQDTTAPAPAETPAAAPAEPVTPEAMPAAKPATSSGANPMASSDAGLHQGNGLVEEIGKDTITLSHGPIPSLKWGAMTMGFKLPAQAQVVLPGARENKSAPLSDEDLVTMLKARGIQIARRTVAKYRTELGVLPSHLRRSY